MKSKIIVALLIMNMVISASAQNQNQYGLVYRDAVSENVVGKVNIHPVSYEVGGIGVVANIYTPANYDSSKEYVAIVVAHPNGGRERTSCGSLCATAGRAWIYNYRCRCALSRSKWW